MNIKNTKRKPANLDWNKYSFSDRNNILKCKSLDWLMASI